MVQLLQALADEFADFAQGMVRGNPLLRMNVRKHPALILRPSAHLQSSRRIRGELNHHSFALARFFSKLLEPTDRPRRTLQRLEARSRGSVASTVGRVQRFQDSIAQARSNRASRHTLKAAPAVAIVVSESGATKKAGATVFGNRALTGKPLRHASRWKLSHPSPSAC